ncbi:MAG: phosphotransferase enzyme family protein [Myxococcota bacterium]
MIPEAWGALRGLPVRPAADGGLINATYYAGDPPRWVVQRVNPIFRPEVHEDIEAVTAHLAARGLRTPRLLRTDAGRLCHLAEGGASWRVMDFVPGKTFHRVESPAIAEAGARLVARFHLAVDDLRWDYRNVRPQAHDTRWHLAQLEAGLPRAEGEARAVAEAILEGWRTFGGRLDLPPRHVHGDLKISNLRFDDAGEALCLLDLDTLSRWPIDVELGDAWRSWCNPVGEDSPDTRFDLDVFEAAVRGYVAVRALTREEREALPFAAERIALELASRFCRDTWEDSYFGWNSARFPSRPAHNLFRAKGQLALARSARVQIAEMARVLGG